MNMNYDEWEEKYKPIQVRSLIPSAPLSEFSGTMFDTIGFQKEIVSLQQDDKIWTLVEEDGESYIISGWHFVNRMGYFITKNPWTENVLVPMEEGE